MTLKFLLGNDKLIQINSCDKSIIEAHTICTSHIVFMCLSGIPKQISHKTISFRQEQNRSLWRKMHCMSDTLLGIKEWPESFTSLLTLSLFLAFPKEPLLTRDSRNGRNRPTPWIAQKAQKFIWTQKEVPEMRKTAEHATSSEESYRKRSPNSLTPKHNWKKVNVHNQESKNLATAQKNRWEHDSIRCVKDNICESKWDYKELQ